MHMFAILELGNSSGSMPDPCDFNQGVRMLETIDDAAGPTNDFANVGVFELRHNSSRFRIVAKAMNGLENVANELLRRTRVILGYVGE